MSEKQTLEDRKFKLAEALQAERKSLMNQGSTDGKDHWLAIMYLGNINNEYDKNINLEDYEILQACVEDLETIMKDYEV